MLLRTPLKVIMTIESFRPLGIPLVQLLLRIFQPRTRQADSSSEDVGAGLNQDLEIVVDRILKRAYLGIPAQHRSRDLSNLDAAVPVVSAALVAAGRDFDAVNGPRALGGRIRAEAVAAAKLGQVNEEVTTLAVDLVADLWRQVDQLDAARSGRRPDEARRPSRRGWRESRYVAEGQGSDPEDYYHGKQAEFAPDSRGVAVLTLGGKREYLDEREELARGFHVVTLDSGGVHDGQLSGEPSGAPDGDGDGVAPALPAMAKSCDHDEEPKNTHESENTSNVHDSEDHWGDSPPGSTGERHGLIDDDICDGNQLVDLDDELEEEELNDDLDADYQLVDLSHDLDEDDDDDEEGEDEDEGEGEGEGEDFDVEDNEDDFDVEDEYLDEEDSDDDVGMSRDLLLDGHERAAEMSRRA